MAVGTNAFWREVMDFLPGLTLLFRIDEQELAHLMFVTEAIRNELGFTPEEYVLSSEDEKTIVSKDLDLLIDAIAERSHGTEISSDPVCKLTDRTGQSLEYTFDFRLFRTKSSKHNFISVTLFPLGTVTGLQTSQEAPAVDSLFVAESKLTKDVLERIDTLSKQPLHVLIRGEQAVGKRTLAENLAQKAVVLSGNQQVWVLNLPEFGEKTRTKQRLFAGLDESNQEESLLDDIDKDLQLVIVELGLMRLEDQKDLLKLINTRNAKGRATRIIATSSESIEALMSAGKLDPSLVYSMSFVSVFVPPLRERLEDLALAAELYSKKVAAVMQVSPPKIDDRFVKRLVADGLEGNFNELFRLLRNMLLDKPRGLTHDDKAGSAHEVFFAVQSPVSFDWVSAAYLKEVLRHTSGKIYGNDGAAALLGMKPTTLQSKLKKLNIR
ncbi:MAG: sigma 54-interacting transcriptional regulator [Bacteroidetes bacterium]|nr:sigma 54-interacting transcriptional regulator [Bacteroidota bacterium]